MSILVNTGCYIQDKTFDIINTKVDIFFCIKIQTFVYRVTKFALVEARRRYGNKL